MITHNIRSMFNTGAFFRNADAFGVSHLYLTGYTAIPPRVEIAKTALGAEEAVPWSKEADVMRLVANLKEQGFTIIAFEAGASHTPFAQVKEHIQDKVVAIFGNEPDGVPDELLEAADIVVAIPMKGTKSSLNVAVASGVALWELTRQTD